MAYNSQNIIVGAAAIYIGAYTEAGAPPALPTFTGGASARTAFEGAGAAGWRHVGLTTGGVEVAYAPDFGEVEVDQFLDAAKIFKQRQSVTVSTTFAEATLENLFFAWGQPTDTFNDGTDTLTISAGQLGDAPEERSLAFVGPAPGVNRERVYHLHRVLSVESTSHSLSRSDPTTIPVSLRCLPNNSSQYGTVMDRAVTV